MKELPHNISAENAVLGAALIDEISAILVASSLEIDDFYNLNNQLIFAAIKKLYMRNEKVTVQGVVEILSNESNLTVIGGYQTLLNLAEEITFIENTEQNIRIIKDKSLLRSLITLSEKIGINAKEITTSVGDYLSEVEKLVLEITRNRRVGDFKTTKEIAGQIKNRVNTPTSGQGILSGFKAIDNYLHGFQKGDLVIIAARPSVGKTAFALNLATNIAKNKKKVAIFSLEMAAVKLVERMLASISLVASDRMKNFQYLSNTDAAKIQQALDVISEMDIFIDDSSFITLSDIQAKARKLEGVDLIIIDYIGLISTNKKKVESRQVEVAEYSRGLKALARELNVPILVLSQLSRDSEKRKGDKRPNMSDLRDSGAIEQDADVVFLLYREDYHNQNAIASGKTEANNVIEINIAKHRNGETGVVKLVFHKEEQRFSAYSGAEIPQ